MRKSRSEKWIIGLLALVLMPWLAGCSAVRLAYSNGPQLSWWWLDGYVDFSRAQAGPVKQDLEDYFVWHRRTQLPALVALLDQAAGDVVRPTTPTMACSWAGRIRDALDPSLEHALSLAADRVPGLEEPQLRSIAKQFAKVMRDMQDDYLQRDPADRHQAAVRRTEERVERLYGHLEAAQHEVIDTGITASPFDADAWAAERRRRQRDTLQTLRRLLADHAGHDQRLAALRELVAKMEHSPDADYRAYQDRLDDYNCGFAARIHNATTPEQREHARKTLLAWAQDFRELSAQP